MTTFTARRSSNLRRVLILVNRLHGPKERLNVLIRYILRLTAIHCRSKKKVYSPRFRTIEIFFKYGMFLSEYGDDSKKNSTLILCVDAIVVCRERVNDNNNAARRDEDSRQPR